MDNTPYLCLTNVTKHTRVFFNLTLFNVAKSHLTDGSQAFLYDRITHTGSAKSTFDLLPNRSLKYDWQTFSEYANVDYWFNVQFKNPYI